MTEPKSTSDHLGLLSQRVGIISDRTLRTENQMDRITRELGVLKSILRDIEERLNK